MQIHKLSSSSNSGQLASRGLLLAVAATLLFPGMARASEFTLQTMPGGMSKQARQVQGYAQRHNLTARVFVKKVGSRIIRRIFVPVLAENGEMAEDFVHSFTSTGKALVLHARNPTNRSHPYHFYVRAAFNKREIYASAYDNFSEDQPQIPEEKSRDALIAKKGTRLVVARLGTTTVNKARRFLRDFHVSDNYDRDIEDYEHHERSQGRRPGDTSAECMWWLPNLKTSMSKNLLQKLGTKRTRGPQEMPALAIHAARSDVVEVVGVGVTRVSDFSRMTESTLFGKKPTRGQPENWVKGTSTLQINGRFDDQGSLIELTADDPPQQ